MTTMLCALLVLLLASAVNAEVSYTITVTDEQAAVISAQTEALNVERRLSKGRPPDLTPADLLRNVILGTTEHWKTSHDRKAFEDDRAAKRGKK